MITIYVYHEGEVVWQYGPIDNGPSHLQMTTLEFDHKPTPEEIEERIKGEK